ncbi:hypothetical protein MP631_18430 [Xanthomonas phaseoli pv. phaseoli]|nr:hypothetical protein MP631_18430 [Xanthomonas phaseoli pv. phaseoli]
MDLPLGQQGSHIRVSSRAARTLLGPAQAQARNGIVAGSPSDASSLEELIGEAQEHWLATLGHALRETLRATLQLIERAQERAKVFADNRRLPSDLRELVRRLRRFKVAVLKFSRRLEAERRATRLQHMAERAWEEFTVNNAQPGTAWTQGEWKQRRGRRLSALEMRTSELAEVRTLVTPEQQALCEADAAAAAGHLESWSQEMLTRYALAAEKPLSGANSQMRSQMPPPPAQRAPRPH